MIDLSDVAVVDNHVHPWRESSSALSVEELAGQVAFADTVVTSVRQEFLPATHLAQPLSLFRQTNLGSRYFMRELAHFLNIEDSSWESITAARNREASANYRAWIGRLFDDARIRTLLVDEGGAIPTITLDELGRIAPVHLRRVARSDNFIRDLLQQQHRWSDFVRLYEDLLEAAIRGGAVAIKSVIAYRSGLDVEPVSEDEARANFEANRDGAESSQKVFRDFLLCRTMDIAREQRVWLHVHTGVGDPDIVYPRANPARLYPLLHNPRFRTNRVVLVHAGWPWVGEAAAMAAILPNVYLDLSEGTIFGMLNMRQRLLEVLEACPYSKILYGADASLPEGVWLVARRFKTVLARVLDDLLADGFCASEDDAHEIARAILSENAVRLYDLDSAATLKSHESGRPRRAPARRRLS